MNEVTEFITKDDKGAQKKDEGRPESKIGNVSVRGWIALMITATVCSMGLARINVAEPLYTLSIAAVSFYLGQNAKNQKPFQSML